MAWMFLPFRRYFDFQGRSRRMEFWMFQLLGVIAGVVIYGLMFAGGFGSLFMGSPELAADPDLVVQASLGPLFWIGVILACLWGLGTFIPAIAVTVRRLHDRDMSGWWLLAFIVAAFVLMMIR